MKFKENLLTLMKEYREELREKYPHLDPTFEGFFCWLEHGIIDEAYH